MNSKNNFSDIETKFLNSLITRFSFIELEKLLNEWNENYYQGKDVKIQDWQFDALQKYLYGENSKIGIDYPEKEEGIVELPLFMGSLKKITNEEQFMKYIKNNSVSSLSWKIMPKYDGLAGLYHNDKLYTRGNGKFGQDISRYISNIKWHKNNNIEAKYLKGELILKKPENRSIISGLVHRKTVIDKDIHFIVWDYVNNTEKSIIGDNDVYFYKNNPTWNCVKNKFIDWNDNLDFYIDGIVMHLENNPEKRIAVKFPELTIGQVTRVIGITWNKASKSNKLIPIVNIESIKIGDSKINKVTGHNARYIVNNNIQPGTVIEVSLAGNIIPKIIKTISFTDFKFDLPPNSCWDNDKINLITTEINQIEDLNSFIKNINLKHLGKKSCEKLCENGIDKYNLLSIDNEVAEKILGKKIATKIFEQIATIKLYDWTIFAAALSIVPQIGLKRWIKIKETCPNFIEKTSKDMKNILINVSSIDEKLQKNICDNYKKIKEFNIWFKNL